MPSMQELGALVKKKYPGDYDDIDDRELGEKVKAKFPGAYDDFTDEKTVGRFITEKLPESAGRAAGDIASAVAHPIETGKAIAKVGAGAVEKLIPGEQKHEEAFESLADFYKQRYGSLEAAANTAYEDPVGFLFDVSSVGMAGGGVAAAGARMAGLPRVAAGAGKVASVASGLDPVHVAVEALKKTTGPVLKAGKASAEGLLGASTSTGRAVIEEALERPTVPLREAMRGKVADTDILTLAKDGLQTMRRQRGDAYRAKLEQIAANKKPIDITPIKKALADELPKFGVRVDAETGKLDFSRSTIADRAEASRINRMITEVINWGGEPGDLTPVGVDTLKRRIDDFYTPSGQGRAMVERVRKTAADTLNREVPGYREMTREYAMATDLIKETEKALSLGERSAADTAIKKLTQAMKDNNEFRRELISSVEDATGEPIISMLAGKALEPIAPKGVTGRTAGLGGVAAGLSVSPGFFGLLAISSPRVVGEFMVALGLAKQEASKIVSALSKQKVLTPAPRAAAFQAGRAKEETEVESSSESPISPTMEALRNKQREVRAGQ